jgi:biopolymer transport protein ExbD
MEIIVWVNQQGLVFINGKHVHIENLRYVLKQAQDETSSAGVYLVGHPDARFGTLAGIHKTLGQGNEQQSGLLASNHLYVTP